MLLVSTLSSFKFCRHDLSAIKSSIKQQSINYVSNCENSYSRWHGLICTKLVSLVSLMNVLSCLDLVTLVVEWI